MNTAVNVFSATMPTKNAAIHSMESMKRSMTFLLGGPAGPATVASLEASRDCAIGQFGVAPSPRLRGEGWGEGGDSIASEMKSSFRGASGANEPGISRFPDVQLHI